MKPEVRDSSNVLVTEGQAPNAEHHRAVCRSCCTASEPPRARNLPHANQEYDLLAAS